MIIRLVDPPLHEFLPTFEELSERITDAKIRLSAAASLERDRRPARSASQRRGPAAARAGTRTSPTRCSDSAACGWPSVTPRSCRCRSRAIFEAACDANEAGGNPQPEIMVPLTTDAGELIKARADRRQRGGGGLRRA